MQVPTTQTAKPLGYIPSSLEKKRTLLAYGLLGIFVYMTGRELSPYEAYHIKWATGWWMLFLISIFVFIIPFLIIPFFWIVAILAYLPLVGVWFYNAREAWIGHYVEEGDQSVLTLMYGLGGWFFTIFEIDLKEKKESKNASNQATSTAAPVATTKPTPETEAVSTVAPEASQEAKSASKDKTNEKNEKIEAAS